MQLLVQKSVDVASMPADNCERVFNLSIPLN